MYEILEFLDTIKHRDPAVVMIAAASGLPSEGEDSTRIRNQ